ncbi:hypothetical protein GCM10009663_40110 [Kitasatospora arboriphila]|uniref:Uncharacterized protein n=1 Tax=Kitasatospora arboriphila TaxID=258052 RepID=A0ABN1TL70_9ACTN
MSGEQRAGAAGRDRPEGHGERLPGGAPLDRSHGLPPRLVAPPAVGALRGSTASSARGPGCGPWCALSRVLKEKRGGRTSDDATLFLIEWR